jgi:chromosome transmission fidelity protein 18
MRNLLDVPLHRLREQIDETPARKLAAGDVPEACAAAAESALWVDRYRPDRFVDLLGDERVHRETLAWVKEWDFCVFGRRRRAAKRTWDADKDQPEGEQWVKDEYQRPREKILLLSGPPGLGKTTLAHVVARQAGYRVFEINARSVGLRPRKESIPES